LEASFLQASFFEKAHFWIQKKKHPKKEASKKRGSPEHEAICVYEGKIHLPAELYLFYLSNINLFFYRRFLICLISFLINTDILKTVEEKLFILVFIPQSSLELEHTFSQTFEFFVHLLHNFCWLIVFGALDISLTFCKNVKINLFFGRLNLDFFEVNEIFNERINCG